MIFFNRDKYRGLHHLVDKSFRNNLIIFGAFTEFSFQDISINKN